MKHLIIILSILLLTSPLSVQSKKQTVLYQYKTYSGFIWKSIGNKKVQPKYEGEITNGKPNGQGTQTWSNVDKYVGEWKDGKKHGQGTLTSPYGEKYVGEWKDGEENGQGTYTFSDGSKYVGEFKFGKRNGQGTYTFYDGGKYVGEFFNGKMWNGTKYDENGNFSYKLVNGK